MKRTWLVVNAFLHSKSFLGMEAVLKDAARAAGLDLMVKTNADFMGRDSLVETPRAALFFDKDLRLARRMEHAGLRLFNSAQAIENCDDKTLTALVLEEAGLPQPDTLLCPLTYPGIGYGQLGFLEEVGRQLSFPLVVKEGKGSFGQQVYLVHSLEQLQELVQQLGATELLFQRFIKEAAGQDLRLYVVGNEVVAAIRRINTKGDFRANLENGATAQVYQPSRAEKELALAASRTCGTDFAGVDLLQSMEGPLVCEVNSNAHFLGLMQVTGINPAQAIVALLKEAL